MWFFLKLILIFLLFLFKDDFIISKEKIAKGYGVDKRTFGKWTDHFCSGLIKSGTRKLTGLQILTVYEKIGWPDQGPCLTKGEMLQSSETYYAGLKKNIAVKPEKLGLTLRAYACMDIFPPYQSAKIMQRMKM